MDPPTSATVRRGSTRARSCCGAHGLIDEACPGTKLAITEYNWGADNGASSAIAQAELLSISPARASMPRHAGLPRARTRWSNARSALYLDYDGQGRRVEGFSTRSHSADGDALGAYAVHLPGQRIMLLLINKATTATTATITFDRPLHGAWRGFRFSATSNLAQFGTGSIAGSQLAIADLPPRSANLIELPDSDILFAHGFDP